MKTKNSERKNTLNGINSRQDLAEGKIIELENKEPEAVQDKAQGGDAFYQIAFQKGNINPICTFWV